MTIDWIYFICLAFFLYRGFRKGFLLAICSIIALLAGIAAALKLSGTFVSLLSEDHPHLAKWAPILVYIIVFLIVAWIVRIAGRLLQKSIEMVALGWLNRLTGAALYGLLISLVFSILLWLLSRMELLSPQTILASHTYPVLEPLAPKIMAGIGLVIPLFKDGFQNLNELFEKLNQQISANVGAY